MKRSLSGIEGVRNVEVSYKDKKAWLTADESVPDEVLEQAVERSGFKGKVILREPATGE